MDKQEKIVGLASRFDTLKRKAWERDRRMADVLNVRTNNSELVFEGLFPTDWPKPIIANFIDVVAQDTAEMVGVMPTITAAGDSLLDERSRTRADKLTRLANYYPYASRVGSRLVQAADRFASYGFLPFRVEPNYDDKRPHIHMDDPMHSYWEEDRWGNVSAYARRWWKKASDLAALFPEHADKLIPFGNPKTSEATLEVVKWWDNDSCYLFIPTRSALLLASYDNPIGRIPVSIARRPTIDGEARGNFDDVLWVYAAKAKLAMLSLDSVEKAVQAPLAVPQDVQELAFGPDAVIRSQNPQAIRRVPLEMPQSAMIEQNTLNDELRMGARYPEARSGNIDASLVTGRGVQALMGGFDARIKTAQSAMGDALGEAISMCLEMDEAIWPNEQKRVVASHNGTPYELKYTPSKDIKGDYNVTTVYGVMAGLDPNKALVWGLQGLQAGLFSKSFLRRNLPVSLNVSEEEKVIDVEKLREAALVSMQGLAQAIPQLAANGQDPSKFIEVIADIIESRKKGIPIEEAIEEAFAPEPQEKEPAGEPEPGMGAPPQPQPSPGAGGVGQPPDNGMLPPMMQMLTSLSDSGRSSMTSRSMRSVPAA